MNKITICTVLLALLMGMASIFAGSVNAQTGIVSIQFRGQAEGKCFAGIAEPIPGDGPDYFYSYGIGRGQAQIKGMAQASYLYDVSVLGPIYGSTSLSAKASVSFSWIAEDRTKHTVQAELYSDESTTGAFAPSSDVFTVPPTTAPPTPLRFTGEHMTKGVHGTERTTLSGVALFGSAPPGNPADPDFRLVRMIQVFLLDETSQRFIVAEWVAEQIVLPLPSNGASIAVPASGTLGSTVRITAWDPSYYFKASFKASTKGECLVVCNPSATTADYSAYGNGACSFQGKAIAEPSQYLLPPDSLPLYEVIPGTMEASGQLQTSWSDIEGNRYRLQIQMSPSSNYPYSWLEPDFGYMVFSAGFPLGMPFDYVGTLRRNSETFQVEGKCGLWVTPLTVLVPPGDVNPPDSVMLFLYIQIPWGGKQNTFHFAWVDRDTHALLGGHDLYYPAAKAFKHEVTVSNP